MNAHSAKIILIAFCGQVDFNKYAAEKNLSAIFAIIILLVSVITLLYDILRNSDEMRDFCRSVHLQRITTYCIQYEKVGK